MLERNRTLPSLRMTFDVDLAAADTEATAQAWGRKMAETIVSASERAGGSATQSLPAAAVSVAAAAQGTIQRSLKFEFQTGNHVWAVKNSGTPDPRLLPRKYAPTTKGYREGAGEERGDRPAYLSVGREGGPARKRGHVAFVEAEGPLVMEEAKKGVDTTKAAQFIKEYRFKRTVNVSDLIGERVRRRQLMLVSETDNAKVPAMAGLFNPNTFELRYSNKDGTRLDVHLSEGRRFKAGHIKLMKVGRGERSDIDKKKPAQHIEIWKVTEDANGPVDFLDKRARVELVSRVDNAKDRTMKGLFNPNTWEKNYFSAADFTGSVLSASAKPLDVHMDADGRLQPGRVKFMVKKKLKEAKEQTAIELQSESTGALEFETPKWFREWPELKDRIQEAVDMTKAIDAQVGTAREVTDATILSVMDARKNTGVLGKVVEWPAAFSTAHLKNLRKDKRRLLVQIADPTWRATVQASEAIALSEYESLLKEHERVTDPARWRFTSVKDIVIPNANSIFAAAFAAAKLKDSTLDESLFADLKGFLQLVVTYIVRGQLVAAADEPAKFTFRLMARTNFGSMFKELLSAKEQALFKTIVGNAKRSSDNLLLKELEAPINAERTKIGPPPGLPPQALTRRTRFFFRPVGRDKKTSGPTIHDWLVGITKGKDLLSGSDFSGAMGAKSVETKPGDKDFRRAQFEIRGTVSHGGHVQPAVHWVSYAEHIFDAAARRSADTPDDPTTPKVSEASKTGLKK